MCIKAFHGSLILSSITLSILYSGVMEFRDHSSPSLFHSLSFSVFLCFVFWWAEWGCWTSERGTRVSMREIVREFRRQGCWWLANNCFLIYIYIYTYIVTVIISIQSSYMSSLNKKIRNGNIILKKKKKKFKMTGETCLWYLLQSPLPTSTNSLITWKTWRTWSGYKD